MTAGLTLAQPPPSRCRDLVDESPGPPYSLRQAEVTFHDTEEVGMRYEVNLSILFTELPLLDRPAGGQGRRASTPSSSGGRGRSRCPRTPRSTGSPTAVTDAGVQLVGLNFFAGDMPGGDRGLVSWPARSAEFRDNIDVTVGIGERLGCRAFNALYGNRQRRRHPRGAGRAGRREPRPRRAARRSASAAPCWSSRSAARPRYPLLTAADALAVIDRARRDRPRTTSGCCSTSTTWRSTATTSTPPSTPRRAGSATCRSPTPRAATSPAPESSTSTTTCERIAATGYDGWVGLEYKPSGASADAFDWLPRERRAPPPVTLTFPTSAERKVLPT